MFRAFAILVGLVSVAMGSAIEYPVAHKDAVVDDYFGTKVPDPYRWLEGVDSSDTTAWVNAQNQLSSAYLQNLPERSRFKELLTELLDYERYSVPEWEGNRYIFRKNSGLQNQSVILTQNKLEDAPRVLLDPNQLSADGTIAISDTAVSDDGLMMAYGEAQSGSDWNSIRVRNVESGLDLPDVVKWVKFSGASWTKDSKGFFYSRFPEPKQDERFPKIKNQKLYYHRIGEPQDKDLLIYERPDDPELGFTGTVSHDGRYLILTVSKGTEEQELLYVKRLGDPSEPNLANLFVPIEEVFEADFRVIGVMGDSLFVLTDLSAPRYRVIKINLAKPERSNWTEVVQEKNDLLSNAVLGGGKLLLVYQVNANSRLQIFSLDGQHERDIILPTLGSVSDLSGDPERPELFYAFTSYLYPTTIYQYDIGTGTTKIFKKPNLNFQAEDFDTKQVFCQSKDGTKVPLFVVAKKGVTLDGDNPLFLTGYGGFNISVTPSFSPMYLAWLKEGGVVAQVNLRGGGEYGRTWHEAGIKERKQNVFDDFIAAAEMLVDTKYTRPARIAIQGGSNGGLLVGAVMTQRPELFGAAVSQVGVLDMLRFQKFTVGWAWSSDYGSSETKEGFNYLYRYSPLHNIKMNHCYPSTLVTTGDHDDRVVPAHSFKFIATLQAAQACGNPILIRVDTNAGHGGGKPIGKIINEQTDILAFMWANTHR